MRKLKIKNEIHLKDGVVRMFVKDSRGEIKCSTFDDFILPEILKRSWQIDSCGYVNGGGVIRLHSLILKNKSGLVCDHRDGNKLNNLLSNIRLVTSSVNNKNTKGRGYYFNKKDKKWVVQLCFNRKRIHIGAFKTEIEAKNARIIAEEKYYGEVSYRYKT